MQWKQHEIMFQGDVAVLTSSEDEYSESDVLIFQRPDRWHILFHTIINMYMLSIGMYLVMDDEVRILHITFLPNIVIASVLPTRAD